MAPVSGEDPFHSVAAPQVSGRWQDAKTSKARAAWEAGSIHSIISSLNNVTEMPYVPRALETLYKLVTALQDLRDYLGRQSVGNEHHK